MSPQQPVERVPIEWHPTPETDGANFYWSTIPWVRACLWHDQKILTKLDAGMVPGSQRPTINPMPRAKQGALATAKAPEAIVKQKPGVSPAICGLLKHDEGAHATGFGHDFGFFAFVGRRCKFGPQLCEPGFAFAAASDFPLSFCTSHGNKQPF